MKIYVATSWRNREQPEIVEALKKAGHEVYDFRNPVEGNCGFHWEQIDRHWQLWTPEEYREALNHPRSVQGYSFDIEAMKWADMFIGVQPFGRSASMEMGWAAGMGKPTILLLRDGEPELMVKMFDYLCCSMDEVMSAMDEISKQRTKHEKDN